MENDVYTAQMNMEDITQHLTQKPLIHYYSFDLNNQNNIINGIPILSGGEQDQHVDGSFMNQVTIADNSFVTSQQGRTIVENPSNLIVNNNDFSVPARIGLQENLEAIVPYIFNNWHDTSNSNPLCATFGDNNSYVNKFLKAQESNVGTEFMSYSPIGNIDPNGWQSSNVANLTNLAYSSSNCSNELSLSLATSPTSVQCSEISCSDLTHSMNGTRSGLEQASCSSMELSMSLGNDKHVKFSPAILGSRYLAVIQEILVQIATFSFENLDEINYSGSGVRGRGNKSTSSNTTKRRIGINRDESPMSEAYADSSLQRHAVESKQSQLLMLLQMVDSQYSQCLDEIHTVVSAFHAATELDPQIHAHFAVKTVSRLYKDLRERISKHILSMGSNFNSSWSEEDKELSVETSFIQKQWALQQLKRKDQLWRPQRGLPERSVSVLRDWMFQNFLHPYPKDAEKHLLAIKSGLTRSQVSNWFINARVRLWKPLIEEMYAEMNRRKACRNEGENESSERSRISINNQMFDMN
ncbi:putative transcription factor Homeodomain-TALE-BEL family [Medicago truncatula]|uniref:BEL1-like homeodomain protein n=1 Tax=Medicago truncatula TaxID=3880 RepID=G7IB93_MEDTR|nr:homeobox protein ATH1 [Medicago truncatula]XP_024629714.1 homeobox protein ATH1 [Medicago truncatula]XP_039688428.1 homeobox protein ATH1 [Medicago truncatula]XP_039688429.1 homeobox protein ATH1 [Medicago truncatula]XP_039688431.1 homeobox protein ATH1 [Medicago truncatula]XP_039688433.1 homeobox protein ATH1 [Medicago truncatula]AES59277.1 BEL1-like homeodomain protein [Medicago truncatula]RHN77152.1 putative transcription factor Homeodomain-TALE-BEL family [Medicago truncatula]